MAALAGPQVLGANRLVYTTHYAEFGIVTNPSHPCRASSTAKYDVGVPIMGGAPPQKRLKDGMASQARRRTRSSQQNGNGKCAGLVGVDKRRVHTQPTVDRQRMRRDSGMTRKSLSRERQDGWHLSCWTSYHFVGSIHATWAAFTQARTQGLMSLIAGVSIKLGNATIRLSGDHDVGEPGIDAAYTTYTSSQDCGRVQDIPIRSAGPAMSVCCTSIVYTARKSPIKAPHVPSVQSHQFSSTP